MAMDSPNRKYEEDLVEICMETTSKRGMYVTFFGPKNEVDIDLAYYLEKYPSQIYNTKTAAVVNLSAPHIKNPTLAVSITLEVKDAREYQHVRGKFNAASMGVMDHDRRDFRAAYLRKQRAAAQTK